MDVDYCLAWALADIGAHAVELRLDDLIFDTDDIKYFFANRGDCPVVATYRIKDPSEVDTLELEPEEAEPEPSEVDMAVRMLSAAIIAGADYIDVDMDFPPGELRWLEQLALNYGCQVILSYHNPFGTESTEALTAVASRIYAMGADIAKIVTCAHHPDEAERVLALYDKFAPEHLVAFAMGREGEQSRYDSFHRGAPLMYAAPRRRLPTALGQPLFFDFLPEADTRCWGDVEPPCSKNIAVRAIVAAALTDGVSILDNITLSKDIKSAIDVARQLFAGVRYSQRTKSLTITGHQDIEGKGLRVRNNILDVGSSGLLCRICVPLAALSPEMVMITGSGAIGRHKFNIRCPELTRNGVFIDFCNGHLPAFVHGPFGGGTYNINSPASAQFVTGLMMALPLAGAGEITLKISEPSCLKHIQVTADVIRRFGIKYEDVSSEEDGCVVYKFSSNGRKYLPGRFDIEGDWSAAALWLTLGVIAGESGVENMRGNSLQEENYILDVLETAGADVERYTDPEMEYLGDSVGYYSAFRSLTVAFECDITECPDLLGPLILLALRSEGTSRICGIKALGGGERLYVQEFLKLGADIVVEGNALLVRGSFNNMLHGARVSSHGDHLLAMALLASSKISYGTLELDDEDCIDRSWPDFPLK
jgi:3-phosphoshikimate 1-carboxyvinyltransferase